MEWEDVDVTKIAERADGGSDLSGPGEEDEDIPGVVLECLMHRGCDAVFEVGVGSPRHVAHIDREGASPTRHDWRVPEEARDRA